MAQKGSQAKNRSLNSIKLRDFPENQKLAREYEEREFEEDDSEDTVLIPKKNIRADDDGKEGLAIRTVSELFGDEDKNTAARRAAAKRAAEKRAAEKQSKALSKNVKVKDIGKKHHSASYHIIKVCIFVLLWILVAFLCYQGYKFGYKVLDDEAVNADDLTKVEITITGNESDAEMGEKLRTLGLIDDVNVYRVRSLLYDAEYVAGTYSLSKSYTTEKIINILSGYTYSEDENEETSEETTTSAADTEAADSGGDEAVADEENNN